MSDERICKIPKGIKASYLNAISAACQNFCTGLDYADMIGLASYFDSGDYIDDGFDETVVCIAIGASIRARIDQEAV